MTTMHYIGFDIHKKVISFCEKKIDGEIVDQRMINATRDDLTAFVKGRKQEWIGAMEATLFTGWIYDYLLPYALELKVAHPEMLKAISASKKKNDATDAEKITDLLRCDLLPECYMAPTEHRDLRRVLRYRNLLVREAVKMKNKTAGLLMEVGATYNKKRLYGKKYFNELFENLDYVPDTVVNLLKISKSNLDIFTGLQKTLVAGLLVDPHLKKRVDFLRTIPGIGEIVALT